MDYQVLLYYNYTKIEEPEEFAKNHLAFCKSLDLKGRILVAEEGINGTVSGTVENTTAYMKAMKADPRFADTMSRSIQAKDMPLRRCLYIPSRACKFKARRGH